MAVADNTSQAFSIGRVVNTVFAVIGRNSAAFFLVALIATIPSAVFSFLTDGAEENATSPLFWGSFGVSMILSIFFIFVLQAILTYATLLDLNGQRANIRDAVMVGIRSMIPLLLLGILYSLGIVLAFILLIVPGLIVMTAWTVAVPAYVSENTGITGALSRSWDLTKGYRWPIFALLLIYGVIATGAGALQGVASLGVASLPVVSFAITLIVQTVTAVLSATGAAVIYFELRSIKEGVGPQQLASVFD